MKYKKVFALRNAIIHFTKIFLLKCSKAICYDSNLINDLKVL